VIEKLFFYNFKSMENADTFFNGVRKGDVALMEVLLDKNPDLIQAKDQRGSTPLILATYYNHEEITKNRRERFVR